MVLPETMSGCVKNAPNTHVDWAGLEHTPWWSLVQCAVWLGSLILSYNQNLENFVELKLKGFFSQWAVNIGSWNGLVPSGTKPLPEPKLTQFFVYYIGF